MTSLIHQTERSPFQQVCECHLAHSGINFPNYSSIFFLQLYNTSRSILINNIPGITPQKKVHKTQIWAIWRQLANLLPGKFCQKGHRTFHHVRSHNILLKNCITLILMQLCNKLITNIVVYHCSNYCLEKDWSQYTSAVHQMPIFWGCNKVVQKMWGFSKLQT